MSFKLQLSHQAKKTIKTLDKSIINRLEPRLEEICQDPFDVRISKPLEMGEGERTTRIGNRRIIYTVNEDENTVYVFSIEPRGKAYRKF